MLGFMQRSLLFLPPPTKNYARNADLGALRRTPHEICTNIFNFRKKYGKIIYLSWKKGRMNDNSVFVPNKHSLNSVKK